MDTPAAIKRMDQLAKAITELRTMYSHVVAILTIRATDDKPFRYYESGLEKLIRRIEAMIDEAVTELGDIYDEAEKDSEDEGFVVKDEEATESDYEPSEEEEEFAPSDEDSILSLSDASGGASELSDVEEQ